MITALFFIWLTPFIMAQLARPAIGRYYQERYGKSWHDLYWNNIIHQDIFEPLWPHDHFSWFIGWFMWPIVPLVIAMLYGGEWVWTNTLKPAMEYPGKRLAQNIKHQEERELLPHVKTSIEEDAWQEVEDFLKNKE